MGLSFAQTHAVAELAQHLYDYLPGSSAWHGTYTFAEAASESGVGALWPGGSKRPALTRLLERTLEGSPGAFCPLIERIVRNGIKYRQAKSNPLTRPDMERLNELLQKVGFRIPTLRDPKFLVLLPERRAEPESAPVQNAPERATREAERRKFEAALAGLLARFYSLHAELDRNAAGLSLELLLNELFTLHDLEPNEPFRVVGEQIDGSLVLDNAVYLLEAKWTAAQISHSDLLIFRGKIESKSSFTRGLFISINGFSAPAIQAITTGKQPTFIMMDGVDLIRVLEGHVRLDEVLRRKVRRLAEKGEPFVSVSDLFASREAR